MRDGKEGTLLKQNIAARTIDDCWYRVTIRRQVGFDIGLYFQMIRPANGSLDADKGWRERRAWNPQTWSRPG
jgi:hypothetical protein